MASKVNLFYLERCIHVLKHLIMNKNVFLAPKGFVSAFKLKFILEIILNLIFFAIFFSSFRK